MAYVEGFVIPVPLANRESFIAASEAIDAVFIELGATRVVECWDDDVPEGKVTDFRRAVAAEPGEAVAFSWVEWPDKATREAGHNRMRELMDTDPRFRDNPMPFDGKRMIFGGFTPVVILGE
jgi:uncharacterized protein YbaA (DUF1428 family)